MDKLSELEQKILDAAIYYQTNKPNQAQGADKSYNYWYQSAHAHLLREVMPRFTDSLVGWWPAYFLWGASAVHRQSAFSERVYLYREGTFGTGYIVVTLDNLYTIALKELTARYPRFDTGFVSRLLSRFGGESESRRPLDEDNMAVIALDAIIDAQVIKTDNDPNTVAVRTANETIQVFAHFTGTHDEIVTAIRMAKSGKLATLMGRGKQPAANASRPQAVNEDALNQLRQLKQMLDLRLITEKEYETKKAEILARM